MSEDPIMFRKPASEKALASPINIEVSSSGLKITSGADILKESAWDDGKVSVAKAEINDALNGLIGDRDANARSAARGAAGARAGGAGGGSAPPPPTPLQVKQAEATTKMNNAIAAANAVDADSILEPQQAALIKKITEAADENSINVIIASIPEASSNPADIKAALNALSPPVAVGGKRRRKTNKRARKGKRGTRRHL